MRFSAALLALASCAALEPDYVELSPFYADGSSSGRYANMPSHSSDEDTVGMMVTVGWAVGQMGEAYRNLSMLDVSKGGELTMRDRPTGGVTVNVEDELPPEPPEPKPDEDLTSPPETMDEALIFALWLGAITAALAVAAKTGVLRMRHGLVVRGNHAFASAPAILVMRSPKDKKVDEQKDRNCQYHQQRYSRRQGRRQQRQWINAAPPRESPTDQHNRAETDQDNAQQPSQYGPERDFRRRDVQDRWRWAAV